MDVIEVKAFTAQVLTAINQLLPQLSDNARPITEAVLRGIIASESSRLFMVVQHGRFVGSMTLVFYHLPTGVRARIEDVVVDRSCRGMGMGQRLVSHAIETARAYGATAIDLTSNPNRQAANALYRKMGFEQRHTHAYVYMLATTASIARPTQ